MRTRIEAAEHLEDLGFEFHPEALQPGDGAVGVFAERRDALRVAAEVARGQSLLGVKLPRIFNALLRLAHRVRGVHLTLRELGIPAREGQAFENDDFGARIGRADRGRHPGAARADDDHVPRVVPAGGQHRRCGTRFGETRRAERDGACGGAFEEMSALEVHGEVLLSVWSDAAILLPGRTRVRAFGSTGRSRFVKTSADRQAPKFPRPETTFCILLRPLRFS